MNTTIIMPIVASLILLSRIVAVATPQTAQAASNKIWCFKSGPTQYCSGILGVPTFEKKSDCKTYAENSGLFISVDCKKIDPTKPTK